VLTDEELHDIAARHKEWHRSHGSKKQWYAARVMQQDVPALLITVRELVAERDAAVAALQGTEQVA
jgi:hypothetical protein